MTSGLRFGIVRGLLTFLGLWAASRVFWGLGFRGGLGGTASVPAVASTKSSGPLQAKPTSSTLASTPIAMEFLTCWRRGGMFQPGIMQTCGRAGFKPRRCPMFLQWPYTMEVLASAYTRYCCSARPYIHMSSIQIHTWRLLHTVSYTYEQHPVRTWRFVGIQVFMGSCKWL